MNKGTFEGTAEEILFVKNLNKKNDLVIWQKLNISPNNHWAIRVITRKFGKINNEKILPKADVFIAKGDLPSEYLMSNDYFLDENDLKKFNLVPQKDSGISIKRKDSKRFQIVKMSPKTFRKLFKSNVLAIGASIYCNRDEELIKNNDVLHGWKEKEDDFVDYYCKKLHVDKFSMTSKDSKDILKKIKTFSNNKIKEIVEENDFISNYIFFGIGNFDEPFTAKWIYKNAKFEENDKMPFIVTTGSGRSKGVYTIVLKPL